MVGPVRPVTAPTGVGSLLRAPVLVVLAALSVAEGYRWLGVLHVGPTVVGSLVFGPVGAVVAALAVLGSAGALASGRRLPGGVGPVLAATAAAGATVAAVATGERGADVVAGAGDLLLAALILLTVVVGERAGHRGGRQDVPIHGGADRPGRRSR